MLSETEAQILTDNGSLSPLPKEAKEGVIAMGILGLFSFISCCFLFIYISYRLLTKHSNLNETPRISISSEQDDGSKIALGASRKQSNSDQTISRYDSGARCVETSESNKTDSNSFLTLIHNLLVADMLQSLAFTFGLNWWRVDGIIVSSGSCGAQSFFIMVGSVSISVFLIAISINTFLTIVWGFKLTRTVVRSAVVFNWLFSFSMAFAALGINMTNRSGDIYGRSITLCWLRSQYTENFGVWLQNFWLCLAIAITLVCYAWIFVALVRNRQSSRHMPPSVRKNAAPELSGHHPAFLVYPIIYLITTIPLALLGILASSRSVMVSTKYFNLVSCISSLAGLLDAILWSTTILLSSSKELKEVGLDPFEFIRSPSRDYGNIVWVEGAAGTHEQTERRRSSNRAHIWWRLNNERDGLPQVNEDRIMDDDNLNGIHMDTITSVLVEHSLTEPTEPTSAITSKIPKAYHPTW